VPAARRFTERSRGDASDIDGQLVRASKRERTSETPSKIVCIRLE
jgi:hypothetical protein